MSVTWVGLDSFVAKLAAAPLEVKALTDEGLLEVADHTLNQAKNRVEASLKLPEVDTGEVADSGHVERTVGGAEVIFDHRAALYIHEGVRGNEAHRKFLEGPAIESEAEVDAIAIEALRKAL